MLARLTRQRSTVEAALLRSKAITSRWTTTSTSAATEGLRILSTSSYASLDATVTIRTRRVEDTTFPRLTGLASRLPGHPSTALASNHSNRILDGDARHEESFRWKSLPSGSLSRGLRGRPLWGEVREATLFGAGSSQSRFFYSSADSDNQSYQSDWSHINRRGLTSATPPQPLSDDNTKKKPPSAKASSVRLPPHKIPPPTPRPPMPRKLGRVAVPTPASAPPGSTGNPLSNLPKPASMLRQAVQLAGTFLRTLATFLFQLPRNTWYYISHPSERRDQLAAWKKIAQHEINHYYTGTKLLVADVRTARGLLTQSLHGDALTRRERKQLLRTVSDLFRLVPFSMFILIPFMEFVLPFALRVFPNLLPSTFQDSLKAEEGMKRELQSRIAMAKFFQETLEELAQEQKRKAVTRRQELQEAGLLMNEEDADASGGDNSRVTTMIEKQEDSAASMLEFLEKSRAGEMLPPDVIIRYAKYFQDDLTLDNMPRMQLINMCKYMNMQPYGSDNFLRFQLRHKIRSLKEDDQRILWEGIDALTKMELREAVQERGMRSVGLSKDAYKRALQQWLDLSVNQSVPIALLIMSRSFFLNEEMPALSSPSKASTSSSSTATASAPASSASTSSSSTKTDSAERVGEMEKSDPSYTGLADAISGLDKEVLNEVILQMATSEEKTSDPEIRKLKLEVVEKQNELIRKEKEDRDAAAAKKKEHAEQQAVAEQAAAAALEPASPSTEDETFASAQASHIVDATATESSTFEANATEEKLEVPKEEQELSTEEMAALRTILTDDPVSSEREALGRIKAAMKGEMEADQREELQQIRETIEGNLSDSDQSQTTSNGMPAVSKEIKTDPMTPEEADAYVSDQIEKEDSATASMSSLSSDIVDEPALEEEPEDPVVARLKKRIESMVDKIEVQLSETKGKIGDKLHFLDKDRDGILSREEVAEVLQQVFKKELSFEEAMEIADEMDENHDGVFTVAELLRWIDENQLVKFVEGGLDVDLDLMMESSDANKEAREPESSRTPK